MKNNEFDFSQIICLFIFQEYWINYKLNQMECPICLNDWNSQTCVPLMLNCGHSFCAQCLTLMLTDPKAKEIKCPNCENMMALPDKGLSGLIKNYALISLVESKLVMKNQVSPKMAKEKDKEGGSKAKDRKKKKDVDEENSENVVKSESADSGPDGNGSQIEVELSESKDSSEDGESSEEELSNDTDSNGDIDTDRDADASLISSNIDQSKRSKRKRNDAKVMVEAPPIKMDQRCEKHEGQLIHSFLKQKVRKSQLSSYQHTILCTQCIYEMNLNASQIEIIPHAIREIKQQINCTKNLIQYRKNQLGQAQGYFHRIQQGNRQIIQSKMKEHFGKLREIMDDYEQECEANLGKLLNQQQEKIKSIQDGIDAEMDKLFNDDINLRSLESHDENEIIYMTNIIDDQHRHLAQEFQPNIQFKDISITLQLRESVYSKLGSLLKSNSKLLLDELRQEGEPIRFMDILQRDKHWKCSGCSGVHAKEVIFCEACQHFRPLEMYKNLVNNPLKASSFELNCLEMRRKKEKQLILDQDLKEEDSQNGSEKFWFMISGEWLFQWKCFISNKISNSAQSNLDLLNKVKLSPNKEIGILPPGPICNDDFFVKVNQGDVPVLKQDLELNKHYRGVNYQVWSLLQKIYGGGPVVVREELDIYSEDIIEQYLSIESEKRFKQTQVKRDQEEMKRQGRASAGRYKNIQQRDSQGGGRALSQSSGVQIPNSQALFQKAGIGGNLRQNRHRRDQSRGSLDRRNIFQQHVEEQVIPGQDPSQAKQFSHRRDGSRKRNLFKQNTHAPPSSLPESKPHAAPDSNVVLGSRNLLEKKSSAIMVEKKNNNPLVLGNKSKNIKESIIDQNEEGNIGLSQEAGENVQPDKPVEKQGVGIFMNNIFNGFNAGFKKQ